MQPGLRAGLRIDNGMSSHLFELVQVKLLDALSGGAFVKPQLFLQPLQRKLALVTLVPGRAATSGFTCTRMST